jgi:hypothetical protein
MKKIFLLLLITIFSINTTFASLTLKQETSLKNQTEKVFINFEKTLNKLDNDSQIKRLDIIISRVDIVLNKKMSDVNRFVIVYLNTLLKEKKASLESFNKNTLEQTIKNTQDS